jgi:hypothetical protein
LISMTLIWKANASQIAKKNVRLLIREILYDGYLK